MGEERGRSSSEAARELQKLKQQALEYYRENDVPRKLEELLNSTFYLQPADVYGHLANSFSKLAKPPTICKVVGKKVLDGLGLPTLQVEIFCTVQNFSKSICSVGMATHFEVQENASPELVEGEEAERLDAVSTAVQWVNETITQELQGLAPSSQAEVDQVLRTFFENKVQEDKERRELEKNLEDSAEPTPSPLIPASPPPPLPPPAKKKGLKQGMKTSFTEKPVLPPEPAEPVLCGSMAVGAVSLAVAKTSATLSSNPLYFSIALLKHHQEQPTKLTIPLLMVSLVSCGKSSPGKLNLMKEVICIPHAGLTAKQMPPSSEHTFLVFKRQWVYTKSSTIMQKAFVTCGVYCKKGVEMLMEIQKQINKTIETPPAQKAELKKGHNGGKRGQQLITGKMSHLGCLTITFDTIEQPLLLIQGICENLGLKMGMNLHLAINCAAQDLMDYNKGKYEVVTGTYKNATEMVDLYVDLINKFPSIIALIDPFRKEDSEQWDGLYNAVGSRCYIIAESASKSISKLLEDGNISTPKSTGLIIKHTNQTTMSDLVEITNLINRTRHIAVFGSTEGECLDDSIADLAVGLGVRFIKLGGLSRGERVTKYNRVFTIEEELVRSGTLGFNEELIFSHLNKEGKKATKAGTLPKPAFPTEVA